jgi:hypothetical protein
VCFVVWKFYFEKLPCGRAGVVNNRKERSRNKQETKTIAAIEKKKTTWGIPGGAAAQTRYVRIELSLCCQCG